MTTDFLPRIHRLGPNAYGWTGCNGRAVALTIPLGDELAKAVRGVPESELALPFTEPVPIWRTDCLRKTRAADAAALPAARRAGDGEGQSIRVAAMGGASSRLSAVRSKCASADDHRVALAGEIAARESSPAAPAYRGAAGFRTLRPSSPCSTTAPSFITATRSQICAATRRSWVMKTMERPRRCAQVGQQLQHLRLHRDVERRDRLVRDQHVRLQRQRAREPDALALAAGEFMRKAVAGGRIETDQREQFPGSAIACRRGVPCTIGPCATSSAALRRGLSEANGS